MSVYKKGPASSYTPLMLSEYRQIIRAETETVGAQSMTLGSRK
jgi:hypothetical protein